MEQEPQDLSGLDRAKDGLRLTPKTEAGEKFASDLSKMIEHEFDEDESIKLLSSVKWPYELLFHEDGGVELVPEDFEL